MDIEEINKKIKVVDGLGGMTLNERLWASELLTVFDNAQTNDKELAKLILQALKVDSQSITEI